MSNHTAVGIKTIDVGDYEVLVEYKGHFENDGIGWYEFWGSKCFDRGRDYLVVDTIKPLFTDETKEEIAEIKKLINDNFEDYAEQITDHEEQIQEG